MALTAEEQELFEAALAMLPSWFQSDKRLYEDLRAYAKIVGQGRAIAEFWFSQTYIDQAVGPVGAEPDWLNVHARDRGTHRQYNETDPSLRVRIRVVEDALTRNSLLTAIQAIFDSESVMTGTVAMVELRRDRAFFRTSVSDAGVGGTFTGTLPTMEFAPAVPFARPPFKPFEEIRNYRISIAGASSPGNDGVFPITSLNGPSAVYSNGAGVAEVDPTVTWVAEKLDRHGNMLDGFRDSYFGRGYRFGTARSTIIIILPYGCTPGIEASVREALRQKKGAGMRAVVECRQNP